MITVVKWMFIVLVALGGYIIYRDRLLTMESDTSRSFAEQKNTRSIGYEEGKKVFDVRVDSMWQETYTDTFRSKNITSGTIYDATEAVIISDLRGDTGIINTITKSINASENVFAHIHPREHNQTITVNALAFSYRHLTKTASFADDTRLQIENTYIKSSDVTYINDPEQLLLKGDTHLTNASSKSQFENGHFDTKTNQLIVDSPVKTVYSRKATASQSDTVRALLAHETTITAKGFKLGVTGDDVRVTYSPTVAVSQPDKSLTCHTLHIDESNDEYWASGNVSMAFDNLNWLKKESHTFSNDNIRTMIRNPTTLSAEWAGFSKTNNTLELVTNVEIKQKSIKITADYLRYDTVNDRIHISGNVMIRAFGMNQLETEQLIIDVANETFTAITTSQPSELLFDMDS
jgi:lipopolysaccharide export system protein LptA